MHLGLPDAIAVGNIRHANVRQKALPEVDSVSTACRRRLDMLSGTGSVQG